MLHFWITELRWTAREYRLMPMSAFDVKADMAFRRANVCFWPKADIVPQNDSADIIRWCSSV